MTKTALVTGGSRGIGRACAIELAKAGCNVAITYAGNESKALDTVKELDTVMTETAVVTDFSVGDMWEKLPEYSQMAKELGVEIKGVYEASTLYYQ